VTAEFDSYANFYETLHNENLALVGAESHEFLYAKLNWCGRFAVKLFKSNSFAKTFLDYGCGTGRFGLEFYKYFDKSWAYVGVDPSQACIEEAQAQFASRSSQSSQSNRNPLFFNLESWSESAVLYDFILVACVLHHIEQQERPSVLRRLWKVLRPGGVILIWEHNPWNPVTRKIVKDCAFDRDARLVSIAEMSRLWQQAINEDETGYRFVTFFPGVLRRLQPLEHLLGWLPLGGQWVFWAKK
jgi:SAM-dependent methyltransferase